jgi:carbon monoxide dehydrogenase subunit G
MLAGAMPGARRLEPTGPDQYTISVDVGVGSVKGTYDGTFALSDKLEWEACTVRATASGRPGSVDTVARMRLSDREGGVLLTYEADATVTGPLAGVGQRLMGAAARRTTEQFLSSLETMITAPPEAAAAPETAAPGTEMVAAPRRGDTRTLLTGMLAGAALALLGVAVGRWTARR